MRPSSSWRQPRFPYTSPRAGSAITSPNGVTRFGSGMIRDDNVPFFAAPRARVGFAPMAQARESDPPNLGLFLTDFPRAAGDFGLFVAAGPLLRRAPRGDGHPVLVLPGLMAADSSTRLLRRYLRRLGYHVH